jgi:hypothetical protein
LRVEPILESVKPLPTLLLSVVVSVCTAALLQAQSTTCLEQLEKPVYPMLPRQARIQGVVTAKFSVNANGIPINTKVEGHPLLTEQITSVLSRTHIEGACAGDFDMTYRFVLEAGTSDEAMPVKFKAPSEFVVSWRVYVGGDDIVSRQVPWFKKFINRVFR